MHSSRPRSISYLFWTFNALLVLSIFSILWQDDMELHSLFCEVKQRWVKGLYAWNLLLDERIPRILVLFGAGASIATAGAVMQSLFHNPLASPSTLGLSTGAHLAVVIALILELPAKASWALPVAAFVGAFAILGIITWVTRQEEYQGNHYLLLAGIAITTLLLAIQGTLLYGLRENWMLVQTITEWDAGSSFERSWDHVHHLLPVAFAGIYGSLRESRSLNLLALGEAEAAHLGVDVSSVRQRLFFSVSLLVAGSLAAMGNIPFLGLLLPHLLRKMVGPDNTVLLPLSALGGGTVVLAVDQGLRYGEIGAVSLGNCFALIGGALFLFLLLQKNPRHAISC